MLTYPRTDSRALPEDYIATVKKTLEDAGRDDATSRTFAQADPRSRGWVKPNKRIFNNSKISDHFAIIPTLQTPKHLNEAEQKLYDLVVQRFLAVFYPGRRVPADHAHHARRARPVQDRRQGAGEPRLARGLRQAPAARRTTNLPPVDAGREGRDASRSRSQANQTKPPPRYTEATLLSAMEGAGKLVEDDELREAMEAKGLGTPATRAAIIEGLITRTTCTARAASWCRRRRRSR